MRLIDADALLNRLPKCDLDHDEKITRSGAIMDMICMVDTAPTVEAPQWISAAKRLPEHNKKVLCIGIDGSCSVMLYNHFESGWKTGIFSTNLYCRGLITHWMPLPEPPEVNDHA